MERRKFDNEAFKILLDNGIDFKINDLKTDKITNYAFLKEIENILEKYIAREKNYKKLLEVEKDRTNNLINQIEAIQRVAKGDIPYFDDEIQDEGY